MLSSLTVAMVAVGATAAPAPSSTLTIGNYRFTGLSETLLRVEPKGPMGFEDRTTFMVVNRTVFSGVPLTNEGTSNGNTIVSSPFYKIILGPTTAPVTPPSCNHPMTGMDAIAPTRAKNFFGGVKVTNRQGCCTACESDSSCTVWVYAGTDSNVSVVDSERDVPGANCWPLVSTGGLRPGSGRELGCSSQGCDLNGPEFPNIAVVGTDGTVLWNATEATAGSKAVCIGKNEQACVTPCFWDKDAKTCQNLNAQANLLHWPSPLATKAYGIMDYPRFYTPPWGTAPAPTGTTVDPALVPTNGYDFRNNVAGDTFVFLLGDTIDTYHASRAEFVKLAGPTPVLPDFAFGTWFTYWHSYTETEAKGEVERWATDNLPIDVWALDMNWRNTSNHQDWYYNHPAIPNLFDNFTDWFAYLKGKNLRTYFNDHPYPVASRNAGGLQTSPEEVAFRWNGLSEWMSRGLTYWWFDHNWGFSIPPPFVNTSITSGHWDGLDNAAWGSHVYFNAVEQFDQRVRDPAGDDFYGGRPMTLTKFGLPDWRPDLPSVFHQESPAQHRFPVWWTGDGVPLQGSVQSMVDCGVHDFKPYVHSDCGGDYRPKDGGDLLRWTAHCAFGTIHRFHGNQHQPWSYDNHTEDVIRDYLNARYKLAPSIIAAGHHAADTGYPFVTRCDMEWPTVEGSYDNNQYLFLNDTLVAPIWNSSTNETARTVWIPPGEWQDAWDGTTVTGPKTITVTQPYEKQPMWHRASGGFVVSTSTPGLRIEEGNWSTLTLDIHAPRVGESVSVERMVVERARHNHPERTYLRFASNGHNATLDITASGNGQPRSWALRLHVRPGQRVVSARLAGRVVPVKHLTAPALGVQPHFPFGGVGANPAPFAGPIAEMILESSAHARSLQLEIESL
eukprot:m.83735 g.83735  ORF g.83735 m.83735 type:complete len:895 (+) comp9559_c0_seq1:81-2765(+)